MNEKKIFLYDTTLRDGTQSEDVNFTVTDKIRLAERLIDFGIDYIEGGWPGSNPRDMDFFNAVRNAHIDMSKISAFGSTRRAKKTAEEDEILQALLKANVPNLTIFGKSWKLHVEKALNISLEENLDLIDSSIRFLKSRVDKVYFDAEHFFDGYKADRDYAIKVLQTAKSAGADCVIMCETNGGAMPDEVITIVQDVKKCLGDYPFGIHTHNDSELAVANSILAVRNGATQVQGTINGFGERAGNANLISVIANLQIKYGYKCVDESKLKELTKLSHFVNEIGNIKHNIHQPFVGRASFAHKGGIHVSAILKDSKMYEHIDPKTVGNTQRVLLSDLSGKSNLIYKAKDLGLDIDCNDETIGEILEQLKDYENKGFQYEAAEGSFEILIRKIMGKMPKFFDLMGYRVIDDKRNHLNDEDNMPSTEATIMLKVGEIVEHTAANGNGPVNALDKAVRKALAKFYPVINDIELVDFKVRILSSHNGTQATTRVLMLTRDNSNGETFGTVGVAENIIDASYQALVDSLLYKLMKERG